MSNRRRFPIVIVAALVPAAIIACGQGEPKPVTTTSAGATAPASVSATAQPAESVSPAPSVAVAYEDAEKAYRSGDYSEAISLFTAYTDRRPDNVWGHYMLGLSSWKAGDLAHAAESFNRALELDSTHVKSLLNSSRVYLELNETDQALERVSRALAIEPRSNEALRLRARALYNADDLEGAIGAYRDALVVDGRDYWSMNNLGLIYIELERPGDAIAALARAVELRSNAPVFHNNLGIALEQAGQYASARSAFEAALAADSTYGKAAVNLARVTPLAETAEYQVDLGEYAEQFEMQIAMWKDSLIEPAVDSASEMDVVPPVELDTAPVVDIDPVPEGESHE